MASSRPGRSCPAYTRARGEHILRKGFRRTRGELEPALRVGALAGLSPRTRGIAKNVIADLYAVGLSPRTRGEHMRSYMHMLRETVYAGETAASSSADRMNMVYSCARGRTSFLLAVCAGAFGLSPRTRGNRPPRRCTRALGRSIPAHAGGTSWHARGTPPGTWQEGPARVYPRAGGGTSVLSTDPGWKWGLSPRMRGSP